VDIGHPLATVTPTVDGDVLAVLAQNEATFTPGQLRRLLAATPRPASARCSCA
jgi:hypothetical protein